MLTMMLAMLMATMKATRTVMAAMMLALLVMIVMVAMNVAALRLLVLLFLRQELDARQSASLIEPWQTWRAVLLLTEAEMDNVRGLMHWIDNDAVGAGSWYARLCIVFGVTWPAVLWK